MEHNIQISTLTTLVIKAFVRDLLAALLKMQSWLTPDFTGKNQAEKQDLVFADKAFT